MARVRTPRNGNTQTKLATTDVALLPEVKKTSATVDLQAEIRRRAYELYEQRGCTPGREDEDWLVAEREVLARYNQRQSA